MLIELDDTTLLNLSCFPRITRVQGGSRKGFMFKPPLPANIFDAVYIWDDHPHYADVAAWIEANTLWVDSIEVKEGKS